MQTKRCAKCGEVKSLDLFYVNKYAKDRHCYRCKSCMDVVTRKNYLKYYPHKKENLLTEDGQKICKWCREKKPLSEFNTHSGSQSLRRECKTCQSKWSHEYYKTIAVEERKKRKIHRTQNPDQYRNSHFKRHYGINVDEYNQMVEKQKGKCLICGSKKGWIKSGRRLGVDHDHKTGKVRALLCGNCNAGIGSFKHDPDLMLKAIEYLKRFNL